MINRLLMRIADRRPGRIVKDDGAPYLERYFLFRAFGVTAYLHRFVASDPDRGLHDHPWRAAMTVILSGRGYTEETRYGSAKRRWFGVFGGQHFHRVILHDGPVWTLFVHTSARIKAWGFLRWAGWEKAPDGSNRDVMQFKAHYPSTDDQWWRSAPLGTHLEGRMP